MVTVPVIVTSAVSDIITFTMIVTSKSAPGIVLIMIVIMDIVIVADLY